MQLPVAMCGSAAFLNVMPIHWTDVPPAGPYRWTLLGGIVISAIYWWVRSKKNPDMLPIFIGALGGAFLGAKIAYLLAEGWRDWTLPDCWLRLATGKSIVGGLLGGYAGVEWMKWLVGYNKPTGDAFAFIAPIGLALGRVGCCLQGCCLGRPTTLHLLAARDALGVPRWPAAQVELAFQLVMFVVLLAMARQERFRGRLFFFYLMVYGVFRFCHEFVRDTPVELAGLSGYQWMSLVMAVLGAVMFVRRGREMARTRLEQDVVALTP